MTTEEKKGAGQNDKGGVNGVSRQKSTHNF